MTDERYPDVEGLVERLNYGCSFPFTVAATERVMSEAAAALRSLQARLGEAEGERDKARWYAQWLIRQATAEGLSDTERLSVIANAPKPEQAAESALRVERSAFPGEPGLGRSHD